MKGLILPLGICKNSSWFYKIHCDAWLCSKRRIKIFGLYCLSGFREDFTVQNLMRFGHNHKGWVSRQIKIHMGQQTFVYFGIWFVRYDLRVLVKFQGAHKNTVHFQGTHGQATWLKVRDLYGMYYSYVKYKRLNIITLIWPQNNT